MSKSLPADSGFVPDPGVRGVADGEIDHVVPGKGAARDLAPGALIRAGLKRLGRVKGGVAGRAHMARAESQSRAWPRR